MLQARAMACEYVTSDLRILCPSDAPPARNARARCAWMAGVLLLGATVPPGRAEVQEAYYAGAPAVEGVVPPVSRLRLRVTAREMVEGREYVWWEFTAALSGSTSIAVPNFDAGIFGVRVLSERAPMGGPEGVGAIARYIYRDTQGRVLEYIDASTGKALLPVHQFREACLPRPSRYARYPQGFATAGTLLGHVLLRIPRLDDLDPVSFDAPRVLRLRSDLIMAAQASVRLDESAPPPREGEHPRTRPFTRAEYEAVLAAGMNCFGLAADHADWLLEQPVFVHGKLTFPDSLYRGNFLITRLYLDEPCVRMGWSGGVLHQEGRTEQVAEILRERVASQLTVAERMLQFPKWVPGTIDFVSPPFISWETDYYSAWYQLEAGAAALVHEGRYSEHGEGWHPRDLFGAEGLDGLRLEEQVHCLNGVLRGAARAFDRDWGVSVYKESDPRLRQPALNLAYDMGARYIWFWTYADMNYEEQIRLLKGLSAHMQAHPRGDLRAVNRSARLGIAIPPGCVLLWTGSWGMEREQLTPEGGSYGDITAAALWEGICSSLRGERFDFLIDEPLISSLGYERLVRIGSDGRVTATPPWPQPRAAKGLTLALADDDAEDVSRRMQAESAFYTAPRAGRLIIDGDLGDWVAAKWIPLDERHGFPDGVTLSVTVVNDVSRDEWRMSFHHGLGMKWEQVTPAHEQKYQLEDLHERGVVVTQVDPGSPADKAGIREGDVIKHTEPWPINWSFQMYQRLGHLSKSKGGESIPFTIRRSGRFRFGGAGDLAARVALAVDEDHLYLAARVTDDVHSQRRFGRDLFRGDSVHIGLDPTLERKDDAYGEENQELGFTLQDGRTIVWRCRGRRGQALGETDAVKAQIVRVDGETRYEAAIPLTELPPLSPDLWPICGFDILVNDSDGTMQRKARLDLRLRAMGPGRHPKGFATLGFAPSSDDQKVSAAILWRRRATPQDGFFRVIVAARSPQAAEARIVAELSSLDSPESPPVQASLTLPLTPQPREHSLTAATESPPGRYRLRVQVLSRDGKVAAADALPVYIYPRPGPQ